MVERRFTFDAVAELYDASRPGYPVALIDRVSQAAGLRHGDDVLEIGGGTGKATKPFAERGFRVVALEPGSNLIRVARRSLVQFANVEFMASTFEDWPLETAKFKLVFAAQSFHWIAPDVRFSKAALALAPGGALAVFGSTALPLASQLRDDVTPIYERVAPHLAGFDLGPGWYRPGGELNKLFDELPPPFSASSHYEYSWSRSHTAASYVDDLRTVSAVHVLPQPQREELLSGITEAVVAHGGTLEVQYKTDLYMAMRTA
jgi:SAM-dependent methyltransferase